MDKIDLGALDDEEEPSRKDEALEKLERENTDLKDRMLEERFYWIISILIMLDLFFFTHMETWGGPIAVLVLELLALIPLGRACGVDEISKIANRLIDGWANRN